ncbi:hypothetical protein [Polaromonas sp. A23]|uniref:hypothetical protein n=1 Tax=Polaromonas sp. A23 TaxID=1944133 RepID=UPI0009D4B2B7|nr:hypothetical protein [Polaromonas sp. A23]OOG39884.1 hypothetical protein B0B52_14815 [Polaromonas sp. A23]
MQEEFTIDSTLNVSPSTLWASTFMNSVNWELWPLVRMTAPLAWRDYPPERWESGRLLFRSWVLLLGVLPVDLHSFRLKHIDAGEGFQENSSSWLNREWNHERKLLPAAGGCRVIDHISVVGRVPLLTALLMPVYRLVFRHRHARLRRKYGQVSN